MDLVQHPYFPPLLFVSGVFSQLPLYDVPRRCLCVGLQPLVASQEEGESPLPNFPGGQNGARGRLELKQPFTYGLYFL